MTASQLGESGCKWRCSAASIPFSQTLNIAPLHFSLQKIDKCRFITNLAMCKRPTASLSCHSLGDSEYDI